MQTVLVTGAYGKVGAAVVAQLVTRGDQVVAVDRVAGQVAGVDVRPVDLADRAAVDELIAGCTGVIHLAAHPSPEGRPGAETLSTTPSRRTPCSMRPTGTGTCRR